MHNFDTYHLICLLSLACFAGGLIASYLPILIDYFKRDKTLGNNSKESLPNFNDPQMRFYGDGNTFHENTQLDVETYNGKVSAIWFRCQSLSFRISEVNYERDAELHRLVSQNNAADIELHGVIVKDRYED